MRRRGLLGEEHELGAGLEVPHVLLVGEHDVRHLEQGEAEARRLGQLARSNKVRGRPPCQRRPDLSCFDFGEEEKRLPRPFRWPSQRTKGRVRRSKTELYTLIEKRAAAATIMVSVPYTDEIPTVCFSAKAENARSSYTLVPRALYCRGAHGFRLYGSWPTVKPNCLTLTEMQTPWVGLITQRSK